MLPADADAHCGCGTAGGDGNGGTSTLALQLGAQVVLRLVHVPRSIVVRASGEAPVVHVDGIACQHEKDREELQETLGGHEGHLLQHPEREPDAEREHEIRGDQHEDDEQRRVRRGSRKTKVER